MLSALAEKFLGRDGATSPWDAREIIRDEIFSSERLEQHAASLAVAQRVTAHPIYRLALNSRLKENDAALLRLYRVIVASATAGTPISSAAEWFIDNYHLVEGQIQQIQEDLPVGFYRQLPKLGDGPFRGYPRVFGMAWACVAHSDSRFEPEQLCRFVHAYQAVQPLAIGELWAIAITLRIVLVENLRRIVEQIVRNREAQDAADRVVDRLLSGSGLLVDPGAVFSAHARDGVLLPAFVVQVVKRLRDQDPRVIPALQWLEDHLNAQSLTADQLVYDEHQRQGAANVTVRNIITSMRLISDVNWPDLFESVSLVDAALQRSSDFKLMDFTTRNLYRSAIEDLARGSGRPELEVAQLAADHALAGHSQRARDPGFYLLANGRATLERALGYRPPWRARPGRLNRALGPSGYIGSVAAVTFATLGLAVGWMSTLGVERWALGMLAVTGLIPAVDLAVALVNRLITYGVSASLLPGLDFSDGIPTEQRTLLVVPTLLTSTAAIDEQVNRLEVHYLASASGELYFALLTDWIDADRATVDGDEALRARAAAGIAELNARYVSTHASPRFYLLHRRRVWSDGEGVFMGWERKRGKLHELNRLLRGARDTTFDIPANGTFALPPTIRNVITLDADTRLPRESAQRLIGKIAHPLNRPLLDVGARRVIEGYAILQPRVTPSLPIGREGSLFQRVFSAMTGINSYDAAVSDVYQDLFGQGSYSGKGIYDVDAFEAALAGRVPEGSLLSHDLFEGTYASAGLVSDIEVIEEYPARYDVAAARNHRWARGDWQLLPWLFARGDARAHHGQTLPLLGAWKMLDNLRRTLSAPALVIALFTGWWLPLGAAGWWTAGLLLTVAVPILLPVLSSMWPHRPRVIARSHLRALRLDLSFALLQTGLVITFLAHQSQLMGDAIVRTLYRLLFSRRHLLEWVTAAQMQAGARLDLGGFYRRMSGSVIATAGATAFMAWQGLEAWWVMLPFAGLWLAAPALARAISISPAVAGRVEVPREERAALRLIARRTWRFFETFVTADDHMLPPDNFQEHPQPVLAHRTSPTNLGLYLMCVVSARDFGWLGLREVVERLEATLSTMQRLLRCHGHFYNWYDTRDLRVLEPGYLSSVDSGNLAAHLLAVANGCREWRLLESPLPVTVSGIDDAVRLAQRALADIARIPHPLPGLRRQVGESLTRIAELIAAAVDTQAPEHAHAESLAREASALVDGAQALAADSPGETSHQDILFWASAVQRAIAGWQEDLTFHSLQSNPLSARLAAIESAARAFAYEMSFDFLLDPERQLLSIGYRTADGTRDPSCYDLLASEARLASFFAIAKNDVAARHWFRLGRAVTPIAAGAALISWSGSMFEYLMPSLVMRAPAGSLLEQTNRLIVRRQIEYGRAQQVPWGISESAYNARDLEFTYQYSNFGIPGLGLKRGLGASVVIAPYATGLAAMVDPRAAVENFARLAELGAQGRYGFYEALDYSPARLPEGVTVAIVRAFMAHHQGMTIVALANVLFDARMRTRFHAEPSVQATELLLQERTPRDVSMPLLRAVDADTAARELQALLPHVRRVHATHSATPQTHLLSNGRYSVMLTSVGSGYSRWRNLALTRWREDTTCDDSGSYVYLRDVDDGTVWSAGYQPMGIEPTSYEAHYMEDRVEITRRDPGIVSTLQVLVSPEDDAEVRHLELHNLGEKARTLEVTSYCELVLAPPAADLAHPAFSKLFVETDYLPNLAALVATRRRRAPDDPETWLSHHAVVSSEFQATVEYETDRARFLGRGHTPRDPVAVADGLRLSNSVGAVLDPIFALRYRVRILPGASVSVAYWTEVASSRADLLGLIERHRDANAFSRAATLAWTQAQAQLLHLGISAEEANVFQRLAGHVLYANAAMRPSSAALMRGAGAQDVLWSQSLSGDLPIVLLRIEHLEDLPLVRQLLQAHEYWRLKQLAVDLVILNERAPSYVQDLQTALETVVRVSQSRAPESAQNMTQGSVSVWRTDLIPAATRGALLSAARVVLSGQRGSLALQLERHAVMSLPPPAGGRRRAPPARALLASAPPSLEFFNGIGGFAADGREYVMTLENGEATPMPWINVISNAYFGCQVSAEGGGYTWALNSRENQLTPWSNDPITDRPGEVLYLRDEDSGEFWTPTVTPIRDTHARYTARHGQGYSRFAQRGHDLSLELLVFVPREDPLKICRLTITNATARPRRLSLTAFVEWVLGTQRGACAPFIVTESDAETGALFARNPWHPVFGARVAFADLRGQQSEWTCDRQEFIGRHGHLARPAAMLDAKPLAMRAGGGLDPCAALRAIIEMPANGSTEVTLLLGQAASAAEAQALLKRYRAIDLDALFAEVTTDWDATLSKVQVTTPDRAFDLMLNHWLLYQTLSCRLWARSAFYQASGAYGFRDQLQDGMALVLARPALTREHLLRAASRQYLAGDVQHWWLPPTGQGVRTRIADDRIWLAFATAQYVNTTGDHTILGEIVTFLEGATVKTGEHDSYHLPRVTDESATLFEHCARALDSSLGVGAHGLPLMGTGDWNDGMNRVGELGQGESVWLGWFLCATLDAFAPLADTQGATPRTAHWRAHRQALQASLEREAWDGGWYRRAFFDDGSPLGAAVNDECRIDSIAQSWSVLSGAGDPARSRVAMTAVSEHLLMRREKLALLFAPPFAHSTLEPGYVKGYPPGIRENGGQYTHAAAWSVFAFALLGDGAQAYELFAMLNPISHSSNRTNVRRYKVEPYVVAADIYSVPPHVGRGGWTWYTGAAGWLYRAGLEAILGLHVQGDALLLAPHIPPHWPNFSISYRHGTARYEIAVDNPSGRAGRVSQTIIDGVISDAPPGHIPLHDDGVVHTVQVTLE